MIGSTLSHYSITAELGRGGMGIVYQAMDTKLDRTVAIKVLPSAALASEDDRARFYREAKAAAAIHHPHIASVFEIDEAVPSDAPHGTQPSLFIVMEFIAGATLEKRIKEGPLKLEETIRIGREIADGLKAAHAKNIVHRDIKAANIMLAEDGRAKILDFGLALTAQSTKLTRLGSTLGTAAYMSPEQARGEEVDSRTDLWSLGAVFYEMISGRAPFGGDYEQALVYSILNEDPEPLTALRTGVPMGVEWIVSKCLAKKAEARYQSATDLIVDLENVDLNSPGLSRIRESTNADSASVAPGPESPPEKTRIAWLLPVILGVLGLLIGWYGHVATGEAVNSNTRLYRIEEPGLGAPIARPGIGGAAQISPDGQKVAFVRNDTLFTRDLSTRESLPIIQDLTGLVDLVWSPLSDALVVVTRDELYRVNQDGSGRSHLYTFGSTDPAGIAWSEDGWIYLNLVAGVNNGQLLKIPASGGDASIYKIPDPESGILNFRALTWIDGYKVLASVFRFGSGYRICVIEDDCRTPIVETKEAILGIAYHPAGYLVYATAASGTRAVQLDGAGRAVGAVDRLVSSTGRRPSIARDGTMMLVESARMTWQIARVSTSGEILDIIPQKVSHDTVLSPSPDGRKLLINREGDIWVYDLERGTADRLTFSPGQQVADFWTSDSKGILGFTFESGLGDIMLWTAPGAKPQSVVATARGEFFPSLSDDGTVFFYYVAGDDEFKRDIYFAKTEWTGDSLLVLSEPARFMPSAFQERNPRIDPTGTRLVYHSDRTGRYESYLASYPTRGQDIPVSTEGAVVSDWNRDGTRLYYQDESGNVWGVDIPEGDVLSPSRSSKLFNLSKIKARLPTPSARTAAYSRAEDLFYVPVATALEAESGLVFFENWRPE